jgi:hypothetical protein
MRRGAAVTFISATALLARLASAQAVAVTPSHRIAVAHDSVIELFAADGKRIWTLDGLPYVSTITVGETKLAVVDALDGRVVIADLADGRALPLPAPGTPIDALFIGDDLYLLERDTSTLERIAADGTRASVPTGAYPQLIRRSGKELYVYAGADGTIDELTTSPLARARSVAVPPFATGFAADRRFAYLLYPNDRKLVLYSLDSLAMAGEQEVGRFPIDLAILSGSGAAAPVETPYELFLQTGHWIGQTADSQPGNASSSVFLAIADPARKSIFQVEVERPAPPIGSLLAPQSLAFGRPRRVSVPTAVDRVLTAGDGWVAYDSASRAVYALVDGNATPIAHDVGPHAFSARGGTIAFWNGALVVREP